MVKRVGNLIKPIPEKVTSVNYSKVSSGDVNISSTSEQDDQTKAEQQNKEHDKESYCPVMNSFCRGDKSA